MSKNEGNRHIWKLPAPRNETYKKWRLDWLNQLTISREIDKNFQRLIDNDRVYTCEKHSPRLTMLRWDSLEQRRSKQLAISVFKSLNNLYPESLKNVFKPTSGVHSYNVRGASNNVFVPRPRTEAAKRAFSYRGAVVWNGLENMLKDEVNLNSFKSALSF